MDSEVDQLHTQALSLRAKFQHGGGTSCIEEAIALTRKALELCPSGHPKRFVSVERLAIHLSDRYSQLGAILDINEAIDLAQEALDLCPKGHPHRSSSSNNFAFYLSTRYNRLGAMPDLDEAIVLGREALDLYPKGHPDRPMSLNNIAVYLSTRYSRLGTMSDLDEAIVLDREALDLRQRGHPDRSMSLNNLADDLSTRHKQLGAMPDLDEAIVLDREALDLRRKGHPDRSMSLNNLAVRLSTRYNRLGSMPDLNEAIVLTREALVLRPQGHPDRSMSLDNLAIHLSTRYNQLGTMPDIDEAILLAREALDLCPKGHPGRSISLNNLAQYLSIRHKRLGSTQDLDEAIVLDREALILRPKGHPERSMSLNNLAIRLSSRYKDLGSTQDLDEAISLDREALDLRQARHPDRSMSLNSLAIHLSTRYDQLGDMSNLDEAIALNKEALEFCPKGNPRRSMILNNLAVRLSTRYDQLGEIPDLDESIDLDREALDLRPKGHPDRSQSLRNLAGHLRNRFRQSKQLQDQEEVFDLYTQLTHVTQLVSSTDLSAARNWIDAAEDFQHPTLLLAYETSLQLLIQHVAALPSLPEHLVILKDITSSLAMDAFSACIRNRSPTKAVELLEQGRGVFWSQLARLRSPVEDIATYNPVGKMLADEFSRLASLVRIILNSPGADQHERIFHLNLEMQKVVTKIRELPGHSRFLLPPVFSDLQRAAKGGPIIVVNASKYTCDALVISLARDPVHIPLQITQKDVRELAAELSTLTKRATRHNATKQLAFVLRKLWDQIVCPIVNFLRTICPTPSRIWWCPTAEFSQLPLHAAGPFRTGQKNLPDLYISSYTPTLTALIRARQSMPSDSAVPQKRFVAIGQGNAVGQRELPSVGAELDGINQRVGSLATFIRIDGEESRIARVAEALSKSEWVHLSCHGLPNRMQPFESAFALYDGHFTIQRIIGCDLKNPEFAYLSACHTTVGYEDSPDEVIDLASAMQFAGFRSVIGTMWAVDDGETKKVASMFYKYMADESGRLDHTRAAYALNKTMKLVNVPFDQKILYIHLGA